MNFPKIYERMTHERAVTIRDLYGTGEYTWRGLADAVHRLWGSDACWEPATNQLAGRDIVHAAAIILGADPNITEPWAQPK